MLVLPAGRPGGHLRLDAPRRRRVPAEARPQPGLRLGALRHATTSSRPTPTARTSRGSPRRQGYDAEATVCAKDGSIIFTSVRDGDIELYRMDADGKNVKRLTNTPGYDGGAFFNADCSKIVWRASRPKPGKELDDFKALLAQNLVRPSKLELYVANADGSRRARSSRTSTRRRSRRSCTRRSKRILFSSNHGDPKGREFDIWADQHRRHRPRAHHVRAGLRRLPDVLARRQDARVLLQPRHRPGQHDTNVFLARWVEDAKPASPPRGRRRSHRAATSPGSPTRRARAAASARRASRPRAFIEERFKALGLTPAGDAARSARRSP